MVSCNLSSVRSMHAPWMPNIEQNSKQAHATRSRMRCALEAASPLAVAELDADAPPVGIVHAHVGTASVGAACTIWDRGCAST